MNQIHYRDGSLFDVEDKNAILVHACNCRGVWGSGIAVEFKRRYPASFHAYKKLCRDRGSRLLGTSWWLGTKGQLVGALFTSDNYGSEKDKPAKILRNTERAVRSLLRMTPAHIAIHSPKINAGVFAVPWEDTEAVINQVLQEFPHHRWIVSVPLA